MREEDNDEDDGRQQRGEKRHVHISRDGAALESLAHDLTYTNLR